MRPLVGILLDPHTYRGLLKGRTGTERIQLYRKAAKKLKISLFFTSLPNIDGRSRSARGILIHGKTAKPVSMALPQVFHNRSMPFDSAGRRKLQRLANKAAIFNLQTRYSKLYIHKILIKNKSLRTHLPETFPFSRRTLKRMMEKHDVLFIKPASGSVGQGIFKLSKEDNNEWTFQASKRRHEIKARRLYSSLKQKTGSKQYLVQEGIPLAHYHGSPFDFRVSVQKNGDGQWQVTGIVGKVAARGKHVTNIGRGGRAKRAAKLFSSVGLQPESTASTVCQVSLEMAKQLESKLPGLADLGLDIGITSEGKPYMIEANGRDQRYSFREAGMYREWSKTYETPLAYAKYLLRGKR